MKIYTGTSGYGYSEWKGKFYPKKISAAKMLGYYSGRLNTVEINNTFYRMPTAEVVMSWSSQVPPGFLFAVKAPQMITHIKRLKNVKEETIFFLNSLLGLGRQLGGILFQFPAGFREDNRVLSDFLAIIPAGIPCAFDFRGDSWHNPETYAILRKRKFALCVEDTDERPVKDITSTASWGYLRLRRENYTNAQVSKWAKMVLKQDWTKAFVYFKHEGDPEAKGPTLAENFQKLFPNL